MFDANLVVGGVSVMALVFGLTEFLKAQLKWDGPKVTWLAAGLGVFLYAAAEAVQYIPDPYNTIVVGVFGSVAFALAASGFYKYGTRNES
jgi:hypothetical protein